MLQRELVLGEKIFGAGVRADPLLERRAMI